MDWNCQLAVFFRLLSAQVHLQSSQIVQEACLRSHDQFYSEKIGRERSGKLKERRVVNWKEEASMILRSGCSMWLYCWQQNYIRDCESWIIRCLVELYLSPNFHRSRSKVLTGWIRSCHCPSCAVAASTLSATVHWAPCQECAEQIFPRRLEVALHLRLFVMGVPTHRAHHPRPPRHWCNFD